MNDDERTVRALRAAIDERAAQIEPGDRLEEILEEAGQRRPPRVARWWVPLAAAAAVLAVVTGAWLGLPEGTTPVPGGSERPLTSTSPSASPSGRPTATPSTAPSASTSTPPPTAAGAPAALPVYYLAPIGDDARRARLYREWLTVPGVTRDADVGLRARTAVQLAMTAVPPGADGYLRSWDGVDLLDVSVTDARITIRLSGPGRTGLPDDTARVSVQQLVWTAQAAVGRGNVPVRFVLADGSQALFGTRPVDHDYTRPASRASYHEDLAPIWVTSPTRGQLLAPGPVTVTGEACVYEATVSWQLFRDGAVVDDGFVTASVGAPDRGTYQIDLGRLGSGSYAVRVYEVSAEDGQRVSAETTMPFTVR